MPPLADSLVQATALSPVTTILGSEVSVANPSVGAVPSDSGDCFAVETRVEEGNPPRDGDRQLRS